MENMIKKSVVLLLLLLIGFSFFAGVVLVDATEGANSEDSLGNNIKESFVSWWKKNFVGNTSSPAIDLVEKKITSPSWTRFLWPIALFMITIFLFISLFYGFFKKKKRWKVVFFVLLGGILLFFAISDGSNFGDFAKGLGIDIPEGDISEVTIGQLFAKDSNGDRLISTLSSKDTARIIGSNIMRPISYGFEKTLAGPLGFVNFWEFLGYFIQMFLAGFLAGVITVFLLYRIYGFGIGKDSWWGGVIVPSNKPNYTSIPLIAGTAYAVLFSIPILKPILRIITLEGLASFAPFPFNWILKALLLSMILTFIVFIPAVIKYYVDLKQKQKKLQGIDRMALGATALRTVGDVTYR
jgi:hypothetical protein